MVMCEDNDVNQICNNARADVMLVFSSTRETSSYCNESNCQNCNMK